mmetsp:Transcript_24251/g.23851  ORF Transcript_24251/g.23851 Transcript_24251/m.23851 type:complete len:83 (+) Transcript_24251:2281-2529(+)
MTAQRHYDFGSGEKGSKRERNQSAKPRGRNEKSPSGRTMDERNLRSVKLTTKDYIENEQEKLRKKGKYGVTVPKPFKFDMRD